MIWRFIIIAAITAIIAGGAVWISDGMHIFSKDKKEQVTEVRDELFGTTNRVVTYVPEFSYGLLPLDSTVKDLPACYAFVLGSSVLAIAIALFRIRTIRKEIGA